MPPRPVEEGKLVYLKLSELHPFHTFRPHPFKVRDDAKMQETVASIKLNGVMVPGLARPEKDGNGYEIVAGHRRCRGSELAGLEEMPFIVRDMTDHEAVEAIAMCGQPIGQAIYGVLFDIFESRTWIVLIVAAVAAFLIALYSKKIFSKLEDSNE